ncbi:MAG: hypothetical protein NZ658_05575, partial [Pirellulales bacterium]|nr:hypothetical protein [Pirellulales bacterium]
MIVVGRFVCLASCLATALVAGGIARPVAAADGQGGYLEPAVQAWMGVVALLADDGERGRMAPPRPEGPRGDALAMLNDIVGRLSRIEAMLAARGPMGGPGPRGGQALGSRRAVSPEMREMMEARMQKRREQMQEARKKWENASPEEREEMKKQWQARMEEGRKKMQEARKKWENASPEEREEMKKQWEARRRDAYGSREKPRAERAERSEQSVSPGDMRQAMQRMREEGRRRMEDAQAKMEAARKRFQEMEQRLKRLE